MSAGEVRLTAPKCACSVETWVQPAGSHDSSTLLAFYSRQTQSNWPFVIGGRSHVAAYWAPWPEWCLKWELSRRQCGPIDVAWAWVTYYQFQYEGDGGLCRRAGHFIGAVPGHRCRLHGPARSWHVASQFRPMDWSAEGPRDLPIATSRHSRWFGITKPGPLGNGTKWAEASVAPFYTCLRRVGNQSSKSDAGGLRSADSGTIRDPG